MTDGKKSEVEVVVFNAVSICVVDSEEDPTL